jgi:hypothetical protein
MIEDVLALSQPLGCKNVAHALTAVEAHVSMVVEDCEVPLGDDANFACSR